MRWMRANEPVASDAAETPIARVCVIPMRSVSAGVLVSAALPSHAAEVLHCLHTLTGSKCLSFHTVRLVRGRPTRLACRVTVGPIVACSHVKTPQAGCRATGHDIALF